MRNNGINDEGASYLMHACSYLPKFRSFHFEKNEVNLLFGQTLMEQMEATKGYLLFNSLNLIGNYKS
jgi:hypothetical protein